MVLAPACESSSCHPEGEVSLLPQRPTVHLQELQNIPMPIDIYQTLNIEMLLQFYSTSKLCQSQRLSGFSDKQTQAVTSASASFSHIHISYCMNDDEDDRKVESFDTLHFFCTCWG